MEPLAEALAHVSETEETLALHDKSLAALGDALARHAAITTLDLSRCSLTSLDGLHHLPNLTRLSLYYNQVTDVSEVNRLKFHPHLRSLDLRLNPVARAGHRYRLCVLRAAPGLHVLDEREVSGLERHRATAFSKNRTSDGDAAGDSPSPALAAAPLPPAGCDTSVEPAAAEGEAEAVHFSERRGFRRRMRF